MWIYGESTSASTTQTILSFNEEAGNSIAKVEYTYSAGSLIGLTFPTASA